MAMANGNRPTMTAEVVGLEVDGDRQVFTVKVSAPTHQTTHTW